MPVPLPGLVVSNKPTRPSPAEGLLFALDPFAATVVVIRLTGHVFPSISLKLPAVRSLPDRPLQLRRPILALFHGDRASPVPKPSAIRRE
jgi:hypothetical protein